MKEGIKRHDIHIKSESYKLESFWRVGCLTWYQSSVWQEVLGLRPLFVIYSPFIDLKVHERLCLICLTFHVRVWSRT